VLHPKAYDEAGLKVLIADDDDELRGILAEALRSDGYEVSEARDGAEMLALLNDTLTDPVARPDVIVADGDRVAFEIEIEIEDECGGLPPGKTEDLFRPFEPLLSFPSCSATKRRRTRIGCVDTCGQLFQAVGWCSHQ
jgi:hypothetical protein